MTLPHDDPAWLERMYNNRALVPDHPAYFARWAQESARARVGLPCALDLPYGDDRSETLDVFPAARPGSPVLVFVHGGYWRSLDKSEHSFVAPPFVQAGACVVVPNYALCPGAPGRPVSIVSIMRQMEAALAWVWRNIARHGGDPQRITVVGHSAGGHLAALLLTSAWPLMEGADLPEGLVRNALSVSGLHDLTPLMHVPFLQSTLQLTEQQVLQASPALLPAPQQGLLHAAVGGDESEEFLRQCRLIQEAWGTRAVPRCQVLPGLHHFSVVDALARPGHDLHHMALNLLRA